jgi:hypothetical protein
VVEHYHDDSGGRIQLVLGVFSIHEEQMQGNWRVSLGQADIHILGFCEHCADLSFCCAYLRHRENQIVPQQNGHAQSNQQSHDLPTWPLRRRLHVFELASDFGDHHQPNLERQEGSRYICPHGLDLDPCESFPVRDPDLADPNIP